jgi:hypothetical protein
VVVNIARRANLFSSLDENELRQEWANGNSAFCRELTDVTCHPMGSVPWSWKSWITQEQRTRCAYTIYLLDTAYVLYYNVPPKIKPNEMSLPLPTEDAAWQAGDGATFAEALRIYGHARAYAVNLSGAKHGTQVRFFDGIMRFMTPELCLPPVGTNVHSKFVMIQALHAAQLEAGWMSYWRASHAAGDDYFNACSTSTLLRAIDNCMDVW